LEKRTVHYRQSVVLKHFKLLKRGGCMHRNKSAQIYLLMVLTLSLLFAVPYSYSGIPQLINYQGKLTSAGGSQIPDGNYDVVFKIYDVTTGGTALWSETWNSSSSQVVTKGGVFNALLGKNNPIPVTFFADHSVTYLGITVGSDSEMTPRQRITSVGYAFEAANGVPRGFIGMWSGSVDQVPAGWALCDGTNGTPNLTDKFIVGAGNSYNPTDQGGHNTINLAHTHTTGDHILSIAEMPSHTHTQNQHNHTDAGHTHGLKVQQGNVGTSNIMGTPHWSQTNYTDIGYANIQPATATNQNSGGNGAHNHGNTGGSLSSTQDIMPPYYALAFIIKL
jgi:hypothetical protein